MMHRAQKKQFSLSAVTVKRNCPQKQFPLSAVTAKNCSQKQFPLSAGTTKETAHKNIFHWALLPRKKLGPRLHINTVNPDVRFLL